jgi:hypothetical protein
MSKCEKILDNLLKEAKANLSKRNIENKDVSQKAEYVCRCISNRAAIRLLMSCLLAKLDRPEIDPRKPYTEINTKDCFSGRTYDERYLSDFITANQLPCNPTTAFLTPALRNISQPLTEDVELIGRPRDVYKITLELLRMISDGSVNSKDLFIDLIRWLISIRDEEDKRIKTLLAGLQSSKEPSHLSSEAIVTLLEQHLACKNVSRLPVLIIAAAYKAAEKRLKERIKTLQAHNAADKQTGAIGDVEITLENDENVVTCYEMKLKTVTINDINNALQKIRDAKEIDNYIFITTEEIEEGVSEYAKKIYDEIGVEIAILDCIGFIRHFLHLFHRTRMEFLDQYQKLVLSEPTSAVSQSLKEAFLALRRHAETTD